ncbi:hypothetical protein E2C01_002954 [Portunus trituberculatus]|uniref:Uncharacterized protein n=1 Tax=Portunus trituberculatus TaxID=210409 RepID=A0A5B7CLM5_PORTR|nr:hypothetical protein [Portunus trituberculatus]
MKTEEVEEEEEEDTNNPPPQPPPPFSLLVVVMTAAAGARYHSAPPLCSFLRILRPFGALNVRVGDVSGGFDRIWEAEQSTGARQQRREKCKTKRVMFGRREVWSH